MASDAQVADAAADVVAPEAEGAGDKDRMISIAGQVRFLSSGERAGLRRIYLKRSEIADGTVTKLLVGAKVPPGEYLPDFDRWRLVVHVAAVLSGTGRLHAHAEGRRLGTALHKANYSENRLLRLLAVRGPGLEDQIRRVAIMLAKAGQQPVNLWTVHDLAGTGDEAKKARIRIAQDYYAAAARSQKGTTSDD